MCVLLAGQARMVPHCSQQLQGDLAGEALPCFPQTHYCGEDKLLQPLVATQWL